jgi:hypothetical protein
MMSDARIDVALNAPDDRTGDYKRAMLQALEDEAALLSRRLRELIA